MFNPAGAIIQAVIAIYHTVQFFIERAQQIAALVGAVLNSIAAIAGGKVDKAVAAVENALAKATTAEKAEQLSHTNAQYLPGVNNKALEYEAMYKGIPITDDGNTIYYIYNTVKEIGFDRGMSTTWVRSELSSGTYHGHPMAIDRVQRYFNKVDK